MILKQGIYHWYAIYTRINREKRVAEFLKENSIEHYLPLKKTLRQWSDRKKWIKEPLFRCYVFVRVSYIEYFNVLNIPGVVKYICFAGVPQSIPDQQIKNIRIFVEQQKEEIVVTPGKIARGLKARVLYGPFKDAEGEVVEIRGQSRLMIRIESLGYSLHANIAREELKIIPPSGVNQKQIIG